MLTTIYDHLMGTHVLVRTYVSGVSAVRVRGGVDVDAPVVGRCRPQDRGAASRARAHHRYRSW